MMIWQSAPLTVKRAKNFVVFDLLTSMLTDNDSSLLTAPLRDKKKIVQNIEATTWSTPEMGQFRLEIDLPVTCDTPEKIKKTTTKIESEIFKIFARISQTDSSLELEIFLESAKRAIINQMIHLQENGQELASSLAHSLTQQGDLFFERDYLKKVMALSTRDISQIVKSFLRKDNFKLALLLPAHLLSKQKTKKRNIPLVLAKNLPIHPQIQSQQSKESLQEIDKHLKISFPKTKVSSFNISNLLQNITAHSLLGFSLLNKLKTNKEETLTILPKNKRQTNSALRQPLFLHRRITTLPKIGLLFLVKGGSFYEEITSIKGKVKKKSSDLILNGSFYLLAKMLKTATQNYSAEKMNIFLAKHGIEIIPFASSHYFGFKLYFLTDKVTAALEIFKEMVLKQHFTATNLKKEKQDLLFKIHSKKEEPWTKLQEDFKKIFIKTHLLKTICLALKRRLTISLCLC